MVRVVVPLMDILLSDFQRKFLSSSRVARELFFQTGGDKVAVALLEARASRTPSFLRTRAPPLPPPSPFESDPPLR